MAIKILLVILCGVLGIVIGIFLKKSLDRKTLYFKDICAFCDYFMHDLRYKQTKLKSLIMSYSYISENFYNDLVEFSNKMEEEIKFAEFLSSAEKNEIKTLFKSLGKVDTQTQILLLEERKTVFNNLHKELKDKAEKDGKLYIKLGFLFGLCIGVLIV